MNNNHHQLLEGRTAVVTGATSGIGLYSALTLAQQGAWVIGVGRSVTRCKEAENWIKAQVPQASIQFVLADLSIQQQVRQLAVAVSQTLEQAGFQQLDILVNNAGLFSEKYIRTEDGIELTLAVNHLAPFLLTHLLLPYLNKSSRARVITVSSDSHQRTFLNLSRLNRPFIYNGLWEYKVSKLANVLFTVEFNRRYASSRCRAFAVDPGLVQTEIGAKGSGGFIRWFWNMRSRSGVHPSVPSQTILHLASSLEVMQQEEPYWYNSQPKKPNPLVYREELGRQLWQLSCRFCGLPEEQENKGEKYE